MASQGSGLTPEQRADTICVIDAVTGRLGLRLHDGSIVDPLIGEPYASVVRDTVREAICAAIDAERGAAEILAEALEALANAAESYMRYHAEKFYAESDVTPTGIWPHIQTARAALRLFSPPEPEGRSNLLLPFASPSDGSGTEETR